VGPVLRACAWTANDIIRSDWTEGRNIRIDYRWGVGDPDRARVYAAELVALAPDVIEVSRKKRPRPPW
jgi:hypothetical protein